jgi:hypothetical protein
MKKVYNVMASAAVIASLVVPASAFAASNSRVTDVPNVTDDTNGVATHVGSIEFTEDSDFTGDLVPNSSFTVTFPNNVKLDKTQVATAVSLINFGTKAPIAGLQVSQVGDYTLNVTLPATISNTVQEDIIVNPAVIIDGASAGPIVVHVDGLGSGVPSGDYTVGNVVTGDDTVSSVIDTHTVGEAGGQMGTIRVEETSTDSLGSSTQNVTFQLPPHFTWDQSKYTGAALASNVAGLAGFAGVTPVAATFDSTGRKMTVSFDPSTATNPTQKGILQVTSFVTPDSDANFGDVTATVGGDADSADLTVGTYADYGTLTEVVGDPAELVSGRLYQTTTANISSTDFQSDAFETAKLHIKENVAGSILANRKIKIDLPSSVKIEDVKVDNVSGSGLSSTNIENAIRSDIDGTDNKVEFTLPTYTGKAEFNVKFLVSVKADTTGDLTAHVSGAGLTEGDYVIAKAVAPVAVTSESKQVRVGVKGQSIGDLTITEAQAGALKEDGYVTVQLTDGVTWTADPKVEVVSGDVDIDQDSIDTTDGLLTFKVKGESTKASQIKISGASIDLDRSVPEGTISAKVGGDAIVSNDEGSKGWNDLARTNAVTTGTSSSLDAGEFDQSTLAKVGVANVATPAPGETTANATFTIGKTDYTVNGVQKTLDVAPYTENGRTYLPIRFVAEALGISSDNIVWNDATKTVTLINGNRIASFKVGQSSYTVNGAVVPMDAAAQFKQNRNMIPLRYAAQALGVAIGWDDATQTVTVGSAAQ